MATRADTVLVQLPTQTAGAPQVLQLAPGAGARFGRGACGVAVDIVIADDGVSRVAGEITAVGDHWRLSNFSATATYVVENPEGGGEYVKVPPGRLAAPVPFEFSRIVLPTRAAFEGLKVFAPQHAYLDATANPLAAGGDTVAAFSLDTTAKYFLVLLALCEPRLRDISAAVIPTAAQVVQRLSPLLSCRGLTPTAVHFHIDYLATTKLRIKPPDVAAAAGVDWKREALVNVALRFDLVTEDQLALLPTHPPVRPPGARW